MTDEEKKALEILKDREYDFDELYCTFRQSFIKKYDKSIGIILELIEKQSKEIEEYKKQLDLDYVDKHFVPIERYNQLEKEIEELKEKNKGITERATKFIEDRDIVIQQEREELLNYVKDNYTSNDKIKAKIEEVDKDENASIPDFIEYAKEYATQKLQSLLEKE